MTACAICGWPVGAGRYTDAQGRAVHYLCRAQREAAQATARTLAANGTPVLGRRQSARRVRR